MLIMGGDSAMQDSVRKILSAVLAVVFLVSTAVLIQRQWQLRQAEQVYESALQQTEATVPPQTEPAPTETPTEAPTEETLPEPVFVWVPAAVEDDPYMEDLAATNLDGLRETNEAVVGWIQIPDTLIDYPIVQAEDNEFYLKHAWDGSKNYCGSIFLEAKNDPLMTEFNTIIYGHKLDGGGMFAGLHKFDDSDYVQAHPYVYLVTEEGVLRYEVFSTYNAPVDSRTYGLSFRQEETRTAFIQTALENSEIDMGITPATTDRILTLSTCTGTGYSARRVVHARLQMVEVEIQGT